MQAIVNVLTDIGNFFTKIVGFAVQLIEDLVYAVELLGQVLIKMPDYLIFFPSGISSLIIIGIGVVVVYKVLGRD